MHRRAERSGNFGDLHVRRLHDDDLVAWRDQMPTGYKIRFGPAVSYQDVGDAGATVERRDLFTEDSCAIGLCVCQLLTEKVF